MKEFFYHKPYGKASVFKGKVDKADFEKLAKLIKIVGLLLQTKVYMFWDYENHDARAKMFIDIKRNYHCELVKMSEIDVRGLFEDFKRSTEPFQGLKMLEWIEARKRIYAKYRVKFSPEKLEELTREEFMSFLDFKVNRSWTGLHRHKNQVTEDMNKLRKTIAFLQDEKVDIKNEDKPGA